MMNRQYKSTSVLLRSPKLRLNEPQLKLSELPNSNFTFSSRNTFSGLRKSLPESQILCNVEDVFKKSPGCKAKPNINLTQNTSPLSNDSRFQIQNLSPNLLSSDNSLHNSNEENYHQDLNDSINSKIPSILDDIHELTLGPNAVSQEDSTPELVDTKETSASEKTTQPCQDPSISSEETDIYDEEIRIYLKNECLERSNFDSSKRIFQELQYFDQKRSKEYLERKKAIELSVIADQLREQSHLVKGAKVHNDQLTKLKENELARKQILKDLQDVKKQKEKDEQIKKEKEKQEGLVAISKEVSKYLNLFKSKEETYLNNLTKCSDVARFQKEGQEMINFNTKVCIELGTLINKCKQGNITNEDVAHLKQIMLKSQECFDNLSKIHETIQADAIKRDTKPVTHDPCTAQSPVTSAVPDTMLDIEYPPAPNTRAESLHDFIHPSCLQFYNQTAEYYKSVDRQLKSFIQDPNLKSFRFQCMRAFNIPINAISGLDGQHTLEQYKRLASVLRGDKELSNANNMHRISQHPLGVLFCKQSMAKKFVAQVDVKPRVLFAYASVIVELWREFPDFGTLLLGEFHKECPYLIPVFWPQLEGQTNEDYYKRLGYQYIDGQVEKQDLFLKRMTAMCQLYAALTITPTRASSPTPHPHNLQFSWRWMGAMLNLEPQADVSATLLHSYIKIAGNKMAATYRTQFFKLIHFIRNHYLRKIKQVTPDGQSQQSIAILEQLIDSIAKSNHVPPPDGQLPPKFW